MLTAPISRRMGAVGFVLAAVLLAVGAAVLFIPGSGTKEPDIVGPGAAPPAQTAAAKPSQAKIFDSAESAQETADGASGVVSDLTPLTTRDFDAPIARYRVYAAGRTDTLTAQARALTTALRRNDRAAAQVAWQRADSTFARIGAAYGALGPLGDAIDGSPGGLPGGIHDPRFTGLQRIEQGLWTGTAPASLATVGVRLQRDVARLRRSVRSSPLDPLTYATRAHEILEDVQRDRLSTPTPSDSGVRATADAVAVTRVVLGTLSGLLAGRGDAQSQAQFWLRRLGATLAAIRHAHGGRYPAVAQLTHTERQTLDGRLGATLEALSDIPGELETTAHPAPARIP